MFKFELEQKVKIGKSSGKGEVVGQANYLEAPKQYLVRYFDKDGYPVEQWFVESTLTESY